MFFALFFIFFDVHGRNRLTRDHSLFLENYADDAYGYFKEYTFFFSRFSSEHYMRVFFADYFSLYDMNYHVSRSVQFFVSFLSFLWLRYVTK